MIVAPAIETPHLSSCHFSAEDPMHRLPLESPSKLIARLVAELHDDAGRGQLADDLRAAVHCDGTRDRVQAGLVMLGAIAYAHRAGLRPVEIRRFAAHFTRVALRDVLDEMALERCTRQATAFVDAIYLRFGPVGFDADPRLVIRELLALGA